MFSVSEMFEIAAWIVFSYVVGLGLGKLLAKNILNFTVHFLLFLGVSALAWYFGLFTLTWNLQVLWQWLNKIKQFTANPANPENIKWFTKKTLYIISGLIGFTNTMRKERKRPF